MALYDRKTFDCTACIAAPRLQTLNGCHTPITRVVARYNELDYYRCPRQYADASAQHLYKLAVDKYLNGLSSRERLRAPAKLVEALTYLKPMVAVEAAHG